MSSDTKSSGNITYLVPHDFSPIGDSALKHAIYMARQTKAKIYLFHIVKDDKDTAGAKAKLEAIIKKLQLGVLDPKIEPLVKKGNIFQDIGKMAEKANADLIIMGTHGAKGASQKLFGSYAIKVVKSTFVPFMVVQSKPPKEKINNIVFPLDVSKESLQIMGYAGQLALWFNAKIQLVGAKESDPLMLKKVNNHLTVARKKLHEQGVESNVTLLGGSGSFSSRIVGFVKKNNLDMIAISYHTESLIPQFDRFAQNIITNEEEIPVLIVNSEEVSSLYF